MESYLYLGVFIKSNIEIPIQYNVPYLLGMSKIFENIFDSRSSILYSLAKAIIIYFILYFTKNYSHVLLPLYRTPYHCFSRNIIIRHWFFSVIRCMHVYILLYTMKIYNITVMTAKVTNYSTKTNSRRLATYTSYNAIYIYGRFERVAFVVLILTKRQLMSLYHNRYSLNGVHSRSRFPVYIIA